MEEIKLYKRLVEILNSEFPNSKPVYPFDFETSGKIHFLSVEKSNIHFDVKLTGTYTFQVWRTLPSYDEDNLTSDDVQDEFRQWLLQFKQ